MNVSLKITGTELSNLYFDPFILRILHLLGLRICDSGRKIPKIKLPNTEEWLWAMSTTFEWATVHTTAQELGAGKLQDILSLERSRRVFNALWQEEVMAILGFSAPIFCPYEVYSRTDLFGLRLCSLWSICRDVGVVTGFIKGDTGLPGWRTCRSSNDYFLQMKYATIFFYSKIVEVLCWCTTYHFILDNAEEHSLKQNKARGII